MIAKIKNEKADQLLAEKLFSTLKTNRVGSSCLVMLKEEEEEDSGIFIPLIITFNKWENKEQKDPEYLDWVLRVTIREGLNSLWKGKIPVGNWESSFCGALSTSNNSMYVTIQCTPDDICVYVDEDFVEESIERRYKLKELFIE